VYIVLHKIHFPKTKNTQGCFLFEICFSVYFFVSSFFVLLPAIAFASEAFFRFAVLLLRTPRFVALSIALYASDNFFSASSAFPSVTKSFTSLTAVLIARTRRKLKTCFRKLASCAFFAEILIGIVQREYHNTVLTQVLMRYMYIYTKKQVATLGALRYYGDMIAHLSGTALFKKPSTVVLSVSGVGYRVYCTEQFLDSVSEGDDVSLHTHLVVREDVLDLYGFLTLEELQLFVLLIGVNGIGPRSALGILNLETLEKLLSAIAHGDVGYLTKVSGVGKKSAEKIVLELKDKVSVLHSTSSPTSRREEEDVLEALKTLGYRADDARAVLRKIPDDITDQGAIIKEALRLLS
jgi:holliday junction DNA helicase RuvA